MIKLLFPLLIVSFFLDLAFTASLFGSRLSWPYFTIASLIGVFFFSKTLQKSIGVGIVTAVFLNILMPFSTIGYFLISLLIFKIIRLLKSIFFDERENFLKSNFSFIVGFGLFSTLLFIGQYIKGKITGEYIFNIENINWKVFALKLIINILVYNLIYRIISKTCVKNTKALR